MNNKTYFITGATSGIGKETAIAIAQTGAKLFLTSRDLNKDYEVIAEIKSLSNNQNITVLQCDFASFQSVKTCADNFLKLNHPIDVLINNAGVFIREFKETKDGIESNFAINHLSTFLLTNLLLPALKKSEKGRVILTSSHAHSLIKNVNFEDIEFRKKFDGNKAYQQSKLANLLFTVSLSEKLKNMGISVNALNPGTVNSGLYSSYSKVEFFFFKIISKIAGMPVQTTKQGAETTIYLALSDEVANITGQYFYKNKHGKRSKSSLDANNAKRLWDISVNYLSKYL